MLRLRTRDSLGGGDHGWLKTRHHFAPNDQGHHAPLGCLVIWNDDEIAPRSGFPMHGHRDMEIVTYVREGVLEHADDTRGRGRIAAGNVQASSAGRGIRHAEYNAGDEPLKIFQIWFKPRSHGAKPHWATKSFPKSDRAGRLVTLASGFPEDVDALQINADAKLLGATLLPGQRIAYELAHMRHTYLVGARGGLTVNGLHVNAGDGIAISGESEVSVVAQDAAEIVFADVG
jgi:quercetin 2,3-dioxygenase